MESLLIARETPVVLLAAAVYSASATGATVKSNIDTGEFSRARSLVVELNLSAISVGTTLDVVVQTSLNGGTTWFNFVRFTQKTTVTGIEIVKQDFAIANTTTVAPAADPAVGTGFLATVNTWGSQFRVKYTIVGTSYTFGVNLWTWDF